MSKALNIHFHDIEAGQIESIAREIKGHYEVLRQRFQRYIIGTNIIVSTPEARHANGTGYHVMIELHLHDKYIVASHPASKKVEYKDISSVIDTAFKSIARQIEDYVDRQRDALKRSHETIAENKTDAGDPVI